MSARRRPSRAHARVAVIFLAVSCALAGSAVSADTSRALPPLHFPTTASDFIPCQGCATSGPLPVVATRSRALVWHPCAPGAQCATLQVPLDYAHPNGTQISLALLRVPASDAAHRIGSLLVNPGGPGDSGQSMPLAMRNAALAAGGPTAAIFARFDVVGFDPRGTGASTPRINCGNATDPYQQVNFAPHDPQQQRVLIAETRRFTQACARHTGELLRFVDSTSVARDMDEIRNALGEPTLSYLGVSYGTVLGAAYAHLFPNRIRAFVFDGAVNPNTIRDLVAATSQQAGAVESAFETFAQNCATRPDCAFYSGGDPAGGFDQLVASLADKPLKVSGRRITQNQVVSTVAVELAVLPESRATIESALGLAQHGDATNIAALYDQDFERAPIPTNFLEANTAITCIDSHTPRGAAGYHALITRVEAKEPRFGQAFMSGNLPCVYWPVRPKPPNLSVPPAVPPILIVGSTGDPLNGGTAAHAMAQSIPGSVLLVRNGEGHGSYLFSNNQCINDAVSNYLLNGTPPAPGTTC